MAKINIRQSQIAHTYATGSIGDFPGVSAMFLSHDHELFDWGKPEDQLTPVAQANKRRIIKDKRLSDAFGVENFVLPPLEVLEPIQLKWFDFQCLCVVQVVIEYILYLSLKNIGMDIFLSLYIRWLLLIQL